ncbi:hypothetical protein LEP1GSC084_0030 [Leptospira interrogans serovar Medanensis str. L0448]|nr:hypothetical protein LEP1GSC111_0022 [Leptospira interrogans str. UT126]EMN37138.1 hypothetical protein LEP1GSC084_0030 [Leptospira interrogans serovar Medanensis str. L0448]
MNVPKGNNLVLTVFLSWKLFISFFHFNMPTLSEFLLTKTV